MRQLSDVNQRFDGQRRELMRREMQTRRGVRDEVVKGDSANAGRIEQLLADQFRIERERIDLTEAEQRELGKFLTPVQRARYLGVQEQVRRQMDDLRGRRAGPMDMPNDSGRRRRPPGT
jgi:protein CpxP